MGKVETDEIYVGVDRRGAHFILPVQAKGRRETLALVQIEQDMALCKERFPALICRPVGAQFMHDDVIALFEFAEGDAGVGIVAEKHYKLVPPEQLSEQELATYRDRPTD